MKHYQWVKDEIEKLLAAKVIHTSRSSWSAPIIVVPKGNVGKHLVTDYRALNKVTRKFTWPMPKVDTFFSKLNGATYFTTLDLWAGYHHIPLDKPSIPKTAFNSPFSKYEYVKVSFGLGQAPVYFKDLMIGILKDFHFAIAYVDDIIIFSKIPQEQLSCIRMVKISKPLHEEEQMQLLFQRNPVSRTHPKCYRYQASIIQDTCHTTHATTNYTQTSLSFSWTSQILQKIHQGICQNHQTINLTHKTTG